MSAEFTEGGGEQVRSKDPHIDVQSQNPNALQDRMARDVNRNLPHVRGGKRTRMDAPTQIDHREVAKKADVIHSTGGTLHHPERDED
jgi:hypothetical protein